MKHSAISSIDSRSIQMEIAELRTELRQCMEIIFFIAATIIPPEELNLCREPTQISSLRYRSLDPSRLP
jgi:hypothetical protein